MTHRPEVATTDRHRAAAALMASIGTDDALTRPSWWAQAACRGHDPNLWFPGRGDDLEPARTICDACPARLPCVADALEHGDGGIRGGLTEDQRRRLPRENR